MTFDSNDNLSAEQHNTLMLINKVIEKANMSCKPVFEILGGTGLLFHGVQSVFTVDIDTANELSAEVRELVTPFISDNASEVAVLARNYKQRLITYPRGEFSHCVVRLLSLEDIVIAKLGAFRVKDREDLTKTEALRKCNLKLIESIIKSEFDPKTSELLQSRWDSLYYR